MKLRNPWILLLTAILLLSMTACGKKSENTLAERSETMTAETLLQNLADATKDQPITTAHAKLDMAMSIAQGGLSMDISMDMEMDMATSSDPYASYMDMTMNMDMLGETMSEHSQEYVVVEDGHMMSYTYTESTDTWEVLDLGELDPNELESQLADASWLQKKDPASVTLEEATQTVNGREAYVMHCTVTGEELEETMGIMQDSLTETGMEGLDLTSLNIPTTIWIDADTFQLLQMDLDMMSMSDLLNEMFAAELGDTDDSVSVSFTTLTFVLSDLRYDAVTVPALPEEAKTAADSTDSWDLDDTDWDLDDDWELDDTDWDLDDDIEEPADGIYTISESGHQVRIDPPEGWTVDLYDTDMLSFTRDDWSQSVSYMMFDEYDEDFFVSFVEDLIEPYQADGTYVDHGRGPEIDGMQTVWLTMNDGFQFFFAFGPADGGGLYVDVLDSTDAELEDALAIALDALVTAGETL